MTRWRNADTLPDELDRPCPKCGGCIVAADDTGMCAYVLCCLGHVHRVTLFRRAKFACGTLEMTVDDVVMSAREPWLEAGGSGA